MKRQEIEERMILLGLAGSQAYGTALPTSDTEYKGICIASKRYYLGNERFEQKDKGWDAEPGLRFPQLDNAPDSTVYELRRFVDLALNGNPNILEMLFLDPEQYVFVSEYGDCLIHCRDMFLSQKLQKSFSGYAYAQIKRIENHRRWLLEPPTQPPSAVDFGLTDEPLKKEEVNAFLEYLYILICDRVEWMYEAEELKSLITDRVDYKGVLVHQPLPERALAYTQEMTRSTADFVTLLHNTQRYRQALKEWKAYCDWKQNRNPDRAGMEAKIGFDTKHGSHCIRLLRMGCEAMEQGTLITNRKRAGDADYLKAIRVGEIPYQAVRDEAETLMERLKVSAAKTSLPTHPNYKQASHLCCELVEGFLAREII